LSKLRVSGGEARGRRLKAPKNIRPTQGMVKQAIFNMVGPRVEGAHVLDLFAGSGALGIEALSRGAASVTFVDKQQRGLAILRQNLDALGFKERARLIRGEVVRWLEASPDAVRAADLIFLDPPYDDVVLDRALLVLDRLAGSATVLAEHSRRQMLPALSRLQLDRQRRYGDTMVTVLRAEVGGSSGGQGTSLSTPERGMEGEGVGS
jgi:16S rRNA (guanine966-N2)-methyltransferase